MYREQSDERRGSLRLTQVIMAHDPMICSQKIPDLKTNRIVFIKYLWHKLHFQNYPSSHRVEAAPILTVPSFSVAPLVPRTRRAAGVIAYSSACRERQLDLTQESVLTGFTTLVTLLAATTTALIKSR